MEIIDLKTGYFSIAPVSGRDFVLTEDLDASWFCDGNRRQMTLPPGFRFGPGIKTMPGFWRGVVNPFHLLLASAIHDALYVTRGGTWPLATPNGIPADMRFVPLVTRAEADVVAREIAVAGGMNRTQARVVHLVLRLFGQATWDD